jgi:hypothetical protein
MTTPVAISSCTRILGLRRDSVWGGGERERVAAFPIGIDWQLCAGARRGDSQHVVTAEPVALLSVLLRPLLQLASSGRSDFAEPQHIQLLAVVM